MTNLIAHLAKLGQLTQGQARRCGHAASVQDDSLAQNLFERAEARAGTDPRAAAELRGAALQDLRVVR